MLSQGDQVRINLKFVHGIRYMYHILAKKKKGYISYTHRGAQIISNFASHLMFIFFNLTSYDN